MERAPAPIELTRTLRNVKVPSLVADREGTITWLNEAAKKAFGDVVGQPFTRLVAPEHGPIVRRQLERKLRGTPMTDYEVDVLTADGRRRRAEISSVRIEGGDRCHAIFGVVLIGKPRDASTRAASLTPRQNQVLQMLGEGASTDQIAAALHLSKETVRNHVRHILRALGVHSRLEAVALAHREGLLDEA
ncbi:MAG: LuxR C-terminal-related transcriptional regulator [Gaiellaceae bacterium]